MKKKYIAPATESIKINAVTILAGSPGYGGSTESTSGNLGRENGLDEDFEW